MNRLLDGVARMFTRDHVIWTLTFIASVLTFVATFTHLIPPQYGERVREVSTVLGFIAGKLGTSPLPSSEPKP